MYDQPNDSFDSDLSSGDEKLDVPANTGRQWFNPQLARADGISRCEMSRLKTEKVSLLFVIISA